MRTVVILHWIQIRNLEEVYMSKKYPNEGTDMHFVYGVRALPNGKRKKRKKRRSRYQCKYFSYKGICRKKVCKCTGVTGCKDFDKIL